MKRYGFDHIKIAVILAGSLLSSCGGQLEVTPPNAIYDEQIKEILASGDSAKIMIVMKGMADAIPGTINTEGVEGVIDGDIRYRQIQGQDCMRNLEGNDIVLGDRSIFEDVGRYSPSEEYSLQNFVSASSQKNAPYWNWGWQCITVANKMLNYLDDQTVDKHPYLGEFKARGLILRAYAYNYLMENYQDAYLSGGKEKLGVMLYDVYDPAQPDKPRASSVETYNFIKKDLREAISLLEAAGIGYTAAVTDLDMGVARFILARVSLWTGDWETVVSACDDILAHYPVLMPQAVYGGKNKGSRKNPEIRPETNGFLFNDVNPEVILGFPNGEALTFHQGLMNPFGEGKGGVLGNYERIDERLYRKIADADYRKDCFVEEYWGDYTYPRAGVVHAIPSYINLKFAATHGVGSDDKKNVGDVSCYYMRSSEVLLMKAEAYAQADRATEAKETLDILLAARTRKGTEALTCDTYPSMNGLTALQMVQLQTRIELWGEGGREYYNNKRWNIPVDRTSSRTHVVKSTYPVSGMTLQIPENTILYNPLCVQN